MSPSKLVRRAGIVSAAATGAFLIAMAASPAYAIGTPTLGVGSACPPPALASLIPDGLTCVNGVLATITSPLPLPTPTPAPTTKPPASAPPSPSPNPLTGLVGGVTGTVTNTVTGVTGSVSGLLGGGGSPLPGAPGTPSGSPSSASSGGGAGSTGGGSTTMTGGTSGAGSTSKPAASPDGSSVLGPAAAFLPGLGIANFTDLGSISPLADSIPSPLLAAPESKLAAVQAPLIAAGENASRAADTSSPFSRFVGNKALPGLLIIIATAMVAAVGAGNLRAWQARLAARRNG